MNDQEAEFEALIGALMPFAEQMLTRYGEFLPFGATMAIDGQIASAMAYTGEERPLSTDVIRLLKDGFIEGARDDKYKATAMAYDIRTVLPGSSLPSDAIAISLNHRDELSVVVVFPYVIENGKPIVARPFVREGEADIFPQPSNTAT